MKIDCEISNFVTATIPIKEITNISLKRISFGNKTMLKFSFSEKATKMCAIVLMVLKLT